MIFRKLAEWYWGKRLDYPELVPEADKPFAEAFAAEWGRRQLGKDLGIDSPPGVLCEESRPLIWFRWPIFRARGSSGEWWLIANDNEAEECGLVLHRNTGQLRWVCLSFIYDADAECEDSDVVAENLSELIDAFGGLDAFFDSAY